MTQKHDNFTFIIHIRNKHPENLKITAFIWAVLSKKCFKISRIKIQTDNPDQNFFYYYYYYYLNNMLNMW